MEIATSLNASFVLLKARQPFVTKYNLRLRNKRCYWPDAIQASDFPLQAEAMATKKSGKPITGIVGQLQVAQSTAKESVQDVIRRHSK